jgi:hypothetical protein
MKLLSCSEFGLFGEARVRMKEEWSAPGLLWAVLAAAAILAPSKSVCALSRPVEHEVHAPNFWDGSA